MNPKAWRRHPRKTSRHKMPRRTVIGYMDKVEFDYELGRARGGNRIFASVHDLMVTKPCVRECGIVRVSVGLKEVISQTDFSASIARIQRGGRRAKSKSGSR